MDNPKTGLPNNLHRHRIREPLRFPLSPSGDSSPNTFTHFLFSYCFTGHSEYPIQVYVRKQRLTRRKITLGSSAVIDTVYSTRSHEASVSPLSHTLALAKAFYSHRTAHGNWYLPHPQQPLCARSVSRPSDETGNGRIEIHVRSDIGRNGRNQSRCGVNKQEAVT
jgi:hypothetical protein